MDKDIEKKTIVEGTFENVLEINDHYYLLSKKHQVVILPYTIDSKGLLDKIGVIKDYNYVFEDYDYTLINGYITEDDGTNLVAANRVLYETLKINVTNADDWMYLGNLYNNLTSDSGIDLYCVNLSNMSIEESKKIEIEDEIVHFKMIDSATAITSDDILLLASYLRLFNYFYVSSLKEE